MIMRSFIRFITFTLLSTLSLEAFSDIVYNSPANISVSNSGQAQITIPIEQIKPGNGFFLPVTVSYGSSFKNNGDAGYGWALTPRHSITRCRMIKETDGKSQGVSFTNNDALCLDGQNLVLVSGQNLNVGAVYRKRREDFTKIVIEEAVDGGLQFHIWEKSGNQVLLGTSQNSRDTGSQKKTLTWSVSRISDRQGNAIEFHYLNELDKPLYLSKISYGGNNKASIPAYLHTEFVYETLKSPITRYLSGKKTISDRVLTSVIHSSNSSLAWKYNLKHSDLKFSQGKRLDAVQRCFPNQACLKEVKVKYKSEKVGFKSLTRPHTIHKGDEVGYRIEAVKRLVDMNNDGYLDVLGIYKKRFYIEYGNSNGYDEAIALNLSVPRSWSPRAHSIFVYDLDGDNKVDILSIVAGRWTLPNETGVYIAWGTEDGFTNFEKTSHDLRLKTAKNAYTDIVDLNNDGLLDLAWFDKKGIRVLKNLGNREFELLGDHGYISDEFSYKKKWYYQKHPRSIIDLNGDGIKEIIGFNKKGIYVSSFSQDFKVSEPKLVTKSIRLSAATSYHLSRHRILYADANSDGLVDIIGFHNDGVYVAVNRGDGFEDASLWVPALGTRPSIWRNATRQVADLNGDGFLDFYSVIDGKVIEKATLRVVYGKGSPIDSSDLNQHIIEINHQDLPGWNKRISRDNPLEIVDLSRDGTTDLAFLAHKSLYLLEGDHQAAVANEVIDGFGNRTLIEYASSFDKDVYQKDFEYPRDSHLRNSAHGGILVKKIEHINSHGHSSKIWYKYYNATFHTGELGFLGFTKWRKWDETKRLMTYSFYDKRLKSFGFPLKEEVFAISKDDTRHIRSRSTTKWDHKELDSEFHRFSSITEQSIEKYGEQSNLLSTTVTKSTFDSFGNLCESIVDIHLEDSIATTATNFVYQEPDLDKWTLSLVESISIKSSKPEFDDVQRATRFYYDSDGLLYKKVSDPNTKFEMETSFSRQHSQFGQVTDTISTWPESLNGGLDFEFVSNGLRVDRYGYPQSTRNALGHISTIESRDPVNFKVLSKKDPRGQLTRYTYDGVGNLLTETNSFGLTESYEYSWCDESCPKGAVYSTTTDNPVKPKRVVFFDSEGREILAKKKAFDGRWILEETNFGYHGRKVSESLPYFEGQDPLLIQYGYDDHYDYVRRVDYPDSGKTFELYQKDGFKVTFVNRLGQKTIKKYNYEDKLDYVIDNLGHKIDYSYDAKGRLFKVKDASGHVTTLNYNLLGQVISKTDPSIGTTQFEFNALGKVYRSVDAEGMITETKFNQLGQMIARNARDFSDTWTYSQTEGPELGLLISESGKSTSVDYAYDQYSRLENQVDTVDSEKFIRSIVYDEFGRLDELTYPSGLKVKSNYNETSHLKSLTDAVTGKLYSETTKVNAAGLVISAKLGNGKVVDKVVDPLSQLTLRIDVGDLKKSFKYDSLGNLTSRHLGEVKEEFQYDSLNRLTSYDGISVHYGPQGNIISRSDLGAFSYDGSCGGGPFAVSHVAGTKYCYNQIGQMIQKGDHTITYRPDGLLSQITDFKDKTTFTYTPSGKKRLQVDTKGSIKGPKVSYFMDNYEEIHSDLGIKQIHFIGEYAQVNIENGQKKDLYLVKDHLGSVTEVLDAKGQVLESRRYNAWGLDLDRSVRATNDIGFTGHSHTGYDDLIHMKGRVYDPTIGRFLSPDPYIQEPNNLQSLNRYSYVVNNPVSLTDPSGYFFKVGGTLGRMWKPVKKAWDRGADWVSQPQNQRLVVALAVTSFTGYYGYQLYSTLCATQGVSSFMAWSAGASVVGGGGFASGYVASNGSLEYAKRSALVSVASFSIGSFIKPEYGKVFAHGVVGGASSKANGDSFESGFLSSVTTNGFAHYGKFSFLQEYGINPRGFTYNTVSSAIISGTTAELTGGNFENSVLTSVLQTSFNSMFHAVPIAIVMVEAGMQASGWLSAIGLTWLAADEVSEELKEQQKIKGSPEGAKNKNPTSPKKMNQEVKKGKVRGVKRVDSANPDIPGSKPHVHYDDGTSSNWDGTIHDKHRGTPDPTKRVRDWLNKHNWTPPPRN